MGGVSGYEKAAWQEERRKKTAQEKRTEFKVSGKEERCNQAGLVNKTIICLLQLIL